MTARRSTMVRLMALLAALALLLAACGADEDTAAPELETEADTAEDMEPEDESHTDDPTEEDRGLEGILALDRAVRSGDVGDGDLVLLLTAGTGYTWAASVVRWGPVRPSCPATERPLDDRHGCSAPKEA